MPYGFYQLVRFVAMIVFVYFAYRHFKAEEGGLAFTFAALALLFQPFLKIALGRTIWNIVDVFVAIGLILLIVKGIDKKVSDI
jgi:lipoprotein signal peptidase